ncbi:MAG: hypothetical protein KAQ93_02135 [Spirochaetales bacterium]|nr:hypothetical protein [Spirochaetales bacterium]
MKNIKISVLLLISLLFVSCLEVETTITISDNQSGIWSLEYRIMQEATYLTPGDELKGYNYFPLTEIELKNRINGIAGLNIISISSKNTIIYTEFIVEIEFDSINDIQFFFNTYTDNSLFNINLTEDGLFEMIINNPFPEADSTDTINLISGLYFDKNINITIILPGIVKESNQGLLSENPSEANFSLTILDLINISEPIEWIVQYE